MLTPSSSVICRCLAEGGNGSARGRGKGKGKEEEEEGGQYKASVCLPQTTFGMRANASVREPEIQKLWEELQVQQRLREASTEVGGVGGLRR